MTHVWPSAEDFTDGATAYGNWPGAYIKANLWSTATTIAHPTSGNYTHGFVTGDLYDIYSSDSLRVATSAVNPGSWLWRSIETSANVVATLGFAARVLTGSAHNPDRIIPSAFVFARVSGGTYVSGTNTIVNPDRGYAFGWITDSTLESSWYLLRLDAGPVVTVVASAVFRGAGSFFHNTVNPYTGGQIQLSVSTVAGNVALVGKLIQQRGTSTITTTILSATDSSGSKITAAGRIGFGMSGLQNATGSPGGFVAPYATSFQIDVGGVLTMRDEWSRSYESGSLAGSATVGGTTYSGNSLLQGWVGDYHSPAAFASRLYRSQVGGLGDRINFDPAAAPVGSGSGVGGFLVSQRPPTDQRSMNRSAQVRFSTLTQAGAGGATNSTPFRAAGIFARVSGTGTPSTTWQPTQGYLAIMYREDVAPDTRILLYRWNGTPLLIAQALAFTISVDTNYTFRFDVYNQADASGAFTGNVSLRVFVGGVQVVLDAVHSSVSGLAAGTIIDGSSSRVIEGPMEGLYCFLPNGTKTIYLDAWAEGTLTNSLVTFGSDQASIAMEGEGAGSPAATFTIPYDWGFEDLSAYETNTSDMESGHHVALLRYPTARPAFRISIAVLSTANRDLLLALWAATDGCEQPFTIAHPVTGVSMSARFVDDKLGDKLRAAGVHSFEFEIEKVNA